MDDFGTLARAHTTLTAVQQEFLKRLLVLFPFLADLAHARVRLYLQTKDRKAFVIAAQEWPRTVYLPPDGTAEGRVIRAMRSAMPVGTSGRNRRTSGIASPFIARATIASASSPS